MGLLESTIESFLYVLTKLKLIQPPEKKDQQIRSNYNKVKTEKQQRSQKQSQKQSQSSQEQCKQSDTMNLENLQNALNKLHENEKMENWADIFDSSQTQWQFCVDCVSISLLVCKATTSTSTSTSINTIDSTDQQAHIKLCNSIISGFYSLATNLTKFELYFCKNLLIPHEFEKNNGDERKKEKINLKCIPKLVQFISYAAQFIIICLQ